MVRGRQAYRYVQNNPVNFIDPWGLEVYVCCQPALGWMPVDHKWIKTDSVEAGMGPVKGNCGEAGNGSGDFPGDPVQVCDHSKRNKKGAECEKVENVNEKKVNDQLKLGRPLGVWTSTNQCQSFAKSVINSAKTGRHGASGSW